MPYILALILLFSSPAFANKRMSDGEVREAIIRESIANYKGICPCPYSMHPDGSNAVIAVHSHEGPPALKVGPCQFVMKSISP
jgi:hypothetical protein